MALEGLGACFGHELKNLVRFQHAHQLNVHWGIAKRARPLLWWLQPPWHFGINEIHRALWWLQTAICHSGLWENMHIDGSVIL